VRRRVSSPDGREWVVRSYRFRRPPWRPVDPGLVVLPVLVFAVEAWARLLWAAVTSHRWVEAEHAGPPRSRLSWLTSAEHADAVVEQAARQLELGYERIQPHNARFLGFG
jgi:hypothetical protein